MPRIASEDKVKRELNPNVAGCSGLVARYEFDWNDVQTQARLDREWDDAVAPSPDIVQSVILQAPPPDRPDVAAALAPTVPARQRDEIDGALRLRVAV